MVDIRQMCANCVIRLDAAASGGRWARVLPSLELDPQVVLGSPPAVAVAP